MHYSMRWAAARIAILMLFSQQAMPIGLGDLHLQSGFGERIKATIDIRKESSDRLNGECITLSPLSVDMGESDGRALGIKLHAEFDPAESLVKVSSDEFFEELFAEFSLTIDCAGQVGALSKKYTLLPEFSGAIEAKQPPPIAPPAVAPPAPPVDIKLPAAPFIQMETLTAPGKIPDDKARSIQSAPKRPKKAKKRRSSRAPAPKFELKLSSGMLDMSRVGTLSEKDRLIISSQRKELLSEEDLVAQQLTAEYQIKLLREEIAAIRAILSKLEEPAAPPVQEPTADPVTPAVHTNEAESPVFDRAIAILAFLIICAAIGAALSYGYKHRHEIRSKLKREPKARKAWTSPARIVQPQD